MATVFTHAAAALALGTAFRRPGPPLRFWLAGAACAMAPDLDVIGLSFGIPWGHVLGHRGISHSVVFAAALALVVTAVAVSRTRPGRPAPVGLGSACSWRRRPTACWTR